MQGIETEREPGSVTSLSDRRHEHVQQPLEPPRGGGRMWINGHEVGGPSARFEHLDAPPG
jgi:hypothetical protein